MVPSLNRSEVLGSGDGEHSKDRQAGENSHAYDYHRFAIADCGFLKAEGGGRQIGCEAAREISNPKSPIRNPQSGYRLICMKYMNRMRSGEIE